MNSPFIQLLAILIVGIGQFLLGSYTTADDRPNIVLIVADDLGYADTGFTGSKDIKTPHLDRLAKSGVIFTCGYCNHPFCAPSRAALLAGRYQQRFGFEANPAHEPNNPYLGIDPNEKLFPERLREVGYKTGIIGKWHLGAAAPFNPNNRGFDYFYGFVGGGHDYFSIDTRKPFRNGYLQPLERNGQPAGFKGYLTTALSEDAVSFVETNKDKPFFLFLSYNAPHVPLQAPKNAIQKYSHITDKKRKVYAAMIDVMDRGIGDVLATLDKNQLREKTIVFFLSDNGGPIAMPWGKNFGNGSSNAPFRGGKTNMYEGGLRVPFVVSWPGKIPSGKTYASPVISIDIARTAVESAGGDPTAGKELEGFNLVPFLTGEKTGVPHEALYWRGVNGKRWAIVTHEEDKLVADKNGQAPELYQVGKDIAEANDIAEKEQEKVDQLKNKWMQWNEKNIEMRFENANIYSEKREKFYRESITGKPDAKKEK